MSRCSCGVVNVLVRVEELVDICWFGLLPCPEMSSAWLLVYTTDQNPQVKRVLPKLSKVKENGDNKSFGFCIISIMFTYLNMHK